MPELGEVTFLKAVSERASLGVDYRIVVLLYNLIASVIDFPSVLRCIQFITGEEEQ